MDTDYVDYRQGGHKMAICKDQRYTIAKDIIENLKWAVFNLSIPGSKLFDKTWYVVISI